MLFTYEEKAIIQSHFQKYCEFDMNDEAEWKCFMFNLEQNLASKDVYEELNCAENQLFYKLLSNNNTDNSYPNELVALFQEVMSDMPTNTK